MFVLFYEDKIINLKTFKRILFKDNTVIFEYNDHKTHQLDLKLDNSKMEILKEIFFLSFIDQNSIDLDEIITNFEKAKTIENGSVCFDIHNGRFTWQYRLSQ